MTLLKNQYRLLHELGSGAFGKTYLAEDLHSPSNRRCVIKRLTWNQNPQMAVIVRERFKREAALLELLGRGSQGSIPELYAYFIEGEQYYLVQEWIDGETLTQKLTREGPQPEATLVFVLLGALRALDYIHTRPTPIIHRDIKPDNIMLRHGSGQLALIDFGIVKEVTPTDGSGAVNTILAGTKGYMPPEQAAGRPTFASDIYALGMTAIMLATGRHPGELIDPLSGEVVWRAAAPQVRPMLADTLDVAIRHSGRERYQTARDFAAAIQAALSSGPIAIPPLSAGFAVALNPSVATPTPAWTGASNPPVGPTPTSGVTDIINQLQGQAGGRRATPSSRLLITMLSVAAGLALLLVAGGVAWQTLSPSPGKRLANVKSDDQIPNSKAGSEPDRRGASNILPPPGMAFIAGGVFAMGDDAAENLSEKPSHRVVVAPFFIDQREVTQEEYEAFVRATNRRELPTDWVKGSYPPGKATHPVTYVSWQDACDYAAWAGKRLPTEAEWEFAARGPEGRKYPWGNEFDPRRLNSEEAKIKRSQPVGSFPSGATPEGVLDLAGNVAEWTASDDTAYEGSAYKPDLGAKIVRGGAFSLTRKYASATRRAQVPPDTRDRALGFRCVKDIPRVGQQP